MPDPSGRGIHVSAPIQLSPHSAVNHARPLVDATIFPLYPPAMKRLLPSSSRPHVMLWTAFDSNAVMAPYVSVQSFPLPERAIRLFLSPAIKVLFPFSRRPQVRVLPHRTVGPSPVGRNGVHAMPCHR